MENKYKQIFKNQVINFINDLILVFPNDIFIEKVKEDFLFYLKEDNFTKKFNQYFTQEIEECIRNKDIENIIGSNIYLLPISKENIIKIKLNRYWTCLSEQNKEKVWNHINLLVRLYKEFN